MHTFRHWGAEVELRWLRDALVDAPDTLRVVDRAHARQVLDALADDRHGLRGVLRASGHIDAEHLGDDEVISALADALDAGRLLLCRGRDELDGDGGGGGTPPQSQPPSTPPPPAKPPPYDIKLGYVSFIASGAEDPKPNIRWTVDDPGHAIDSGVLEVFRSHADAAPIFRRDLSHDEIMPGDHEAPWDGEIGAHPDFPQGHASVEFSPYTIRLTVKGLGHEPKSRAAVFNVLATRIELSFGSDEMIGRQIDRDVLAKIKASAATVTGSTISVPLLSNLFRLDDLDMYAPWVAFAAYQWLWGAGPRIPIVASVWIRNQHGFESLAPKAWGRRRLLWSFDYIDMNGAIPAPAGTFVRTSADYFVNQTYPAGTACHELRGGKRSPSGLGHFLLVDAPDLPATAVNIHVRGALTGSREDGDLAGRTAIDFIPAATAGDGYQVVARFDPRADLDVPFPHAELEARTATWVVRRKITISKLIKKKFVVPEITPAAITAAGPFHEASLDIEVPNPDYESLTEERYNELVAAAVAADNGVAKAVVNPTQNQFRNGDWMISFHHYTDFLNVLKTWPKDDPVFFKLFLGSLNELSYITLCTLAAVDLVQTIARQLASSDHGVTLLVSDGLTNLDSRAQEILDAENKDAPIVKEAGASFGLFDRFRAAAWFGSTAEHVVWHELGHLLFLPHALAPDPTKSGPIPAGMLHDALSLRCLMNYDFTETQFCGLCQLRLRGWNGTMLSMYAQYNKAP